MIWFALAGILVAAEIFTGTFYLLMIAVGFFAGGIAAVAGVPFYGQFIAAGISGGVVTLVCAIAGCLRNIGFIRREILPFSSILDRLLKSGNGKIRKAVFTVREPVIVALFGMWNCFRRAGRKPDCSSFVKYGEQPACRKARHDFFNFLTG